MEGAGLFVLAAQLLDGAPGCGQLFFAGSALHGKEVSTHLHQRQAVFCQHGQSRHRAGRSQIELFTPRLASSFLGALLGELHTGKAQLAAGVFQKLHPLAGGFHQGQLQLGLEYLRHDAREARACTDIHHLPCHLRLRGKEQAVKEVLVLDALRVGDGSQVDLLVVLHQNLRKGVQLVELGSGERDVPCGTFLFQSAFINHKLILISQKLIAIFKNSINQKGILLSLAPVARGSFFLLVKRLALRAGQR